eukprot:TRINITY_DN7233_c0_g1_i1.p1 TRINITY_DN7233_c0_g1~~TRINITY_DN7233_c0_g1_i1.p1  ORF type:complete len:754 (+),score=191.14 TRINITY_DN7233_c0_g1_i1:260-2263(+)
MRDMEALGDIIRHTDEEVVALYTVRDESHAARARAELQLAAAQKQVGELEAALAQQRVDFDALGADYVEVVAALKEKEAQERAESDEDREALLHTAYDRMREEMLELKRRAKDQQGALALDNERLKQKSAARWETSIRLARDLEAAERRIEALEVEKKAAQKQVTAALEMMHAARDAHEKPCEDSTLAAFAAEIARLTHKCDTRWEQIAGLCDKLGELEAALEADRDPQQAAAADDAEATCAHPSPPLFLSCPSGPAPGQDPILLDLDTTQSGHHLLLVRERAASEAARTSASCTDVVSRSLSIASTAASVISVAPLRGVPAPATDSQPASPLDEFPFAPPPAARVYRTAAMKRASAGVLTAKAAARVTANSALGRGRSRSQPDTTRAVRMQWDERETAPSPGKAAVPAGSPTGLTLTNTRSSATVAHRVPTALDFLPASPRQTRRRSSPHLVTRCPLGDAAHCAARRRNVPAIVQGSPRRTSPRDGQVPDPVWSAAFQRCATSPAASPRPVAGVGSPGPSVLVDTPAVPVPAAAGPFATSPRAASPRAAARAVVKRRDSARTALERQRVLSTFAAVKPARAAPRAENTARHLQGGPRPTPRANTPPRSAFASPRPSGPAAATPVVHGVPVALKSPTRVNSGCHPAPTPMTRAKYAGVRVSGLKTRR